MIQSSVVVVQLAEQGVDGVPVILAGLRFHLRPVQVGADQPGAEGAGLRTELTGRAEQAVADAADHAEPDVLGLEGFRVVSLTHKLEFI